MDHKCPYSHTIEINKILINNLEPNLEHESRSLGRTLEQWKQICGRKGQLQVYGNSESGHYQTSNG